MTAGRQLFELQAQRRQLAATAPLSRSLGDGNVELLDESTVRIAAGIDQIRVRTLGHLGLKRDVSDEANDFVHIGEILLERDVVLPWPGNA